MADNASVYTDPDNMTKVEAQILMWDGQKWLEISNTRTTNQINDHIQEVASQVQEAQKGIQTAVDTANQADAKGDQAIKDAGFATDTAQTAKQVADSVSPIANEAKQNANEALQQAQDALKKGNDNSTEISNVSKDLNDTKTSLDDVSKDLDDTKTDLQNKIDDNKKNITTANSNLDKVSKDLDTTKSNLQDVADQATKNGKDINTTNSTVSGIKTDLANTKGDVTELKTTASGFSADMVSAKGDISSLKTRAGSLESDMSDAKGDISSLKQTTTGIQSDVKDAKGNISDLQQSATKMQSDIKDNKDNISEVKQTASSLTTGLSSTKGDVSRLQQRADGFDTAISNNAGDISSLKTRASSLESDMSSTKGDVSRLQQTSSSLSSDMTTAKGDISSLKQTATTMQSDIKDNKDNISAVKQTADTVTSTVANLGTVNLLTGTSKEIQTRKNSSSNNWDIGSIAGKGNENIIQGQTYTYRVFISNCDVDTRAVFYEWDASKKQYSHGGNTIPAGSSGYSEVTFVSQSSNNSSMASVGFTRAQSGVHAVEYKEQKLEKGSVATDYSPAPEDKANQSDLSSLQGTVSSQSTQIQQNKSDITQKANQTDVNTLTGRVSSAESNIDLNAKAITSKVSASDVTNMLTPYATQNYTQSQIKQSADDISQSVTKLQNQVDNTQIGGSNLLIGTDTAFALTGNNTTNQTKNLYAFVNDTVKQINGNVGDYYTLSFDWAVTGDTIAGTFFIQLNGFPWDGFNYIDVSSDNKSGHFTGKIPKTSDWDNGLAWALMVRADQFQGTLNITRAKLEKGNVATDYSRADADNATVTAMSSLSQKADQISSTVTNNKTDADNKFSTINQTISGIQSTVSNKADSSQITQIDKEIQTKVSTSDYTSKITQLSNDINLRVKTGDLISQINLSAGNTLIQSNKIYLDADSVVFGNKAFITNAMITSLNAGKITAGSITGSNLAINLDTGSVLFQHGSIKSTSGSLNINIDDASYTSKDPSSGYSYRLKGNTITWYDKANKQVSQLYNDSNSYGTGTYFASQNLMLGDFNYGNLALYKGHWQMWSTNPSNSNVQFQFLADNQDGNKEPMMYLTSMDNNTGAEASLSLYGTNKNNSTTTGEVLLHSYTDSSHHADLYLQNGAVTFNHTGDFNVYSDGNINISSGKNKATISGVVFYNGNDMKSGNGYDFYFDGPSGGGGNATIHVKSVVQQSLLSLKTNISNLDGKQALKTLSDTDVKNYSYKADLERGSNKQYTTVIIDDVNDKPEYNTPIQFLSEDGKGRDDGTMLGYAIAAIKELNNEVKELQAQLNK